MTDLTPKQEATIVATPIKKDVKARFLSWADIHLVPKWRHAYRFISVQAMTLQGALLLGWAQLPDDMKQALNWLLPIVSGFILFVGVLGAVTKQKNIPVPEGKKDE